MTMAVLTGVALLCYGISLYFLGSPGAVAASATARGSTSR
jgi:hypothetical protein